MKQLIMLKCGELFLKGLNRRLFEERLIKNAKNAIMGLGSFRFKKAQSIIYVIPEADEDLDLALEKLSKVFGMSGICKALIVEKDFEKIQPAAVQYLEEELSAAKTFKVEAKRSDKNFAMDSPEICMELGGYILSKFPHLKVDVRTPELVVVVEIREQEAYIHKQQESGAGGIPVGSSGRAALLISGGIDSPVAGYMMAKRGLELIAVHFESPPYTSERALMKVKTLCEEVAEWSGAINLYTVPFTKVQEEIKTNAPEALFTLIMRRYMMKISEKIALNEGCGGLITGESVGQVASQTLAALACTDRSVELPVLRPLIGMDKEEIVKLSRYIGTYETSILPYEDCCTVFTPKRPKTNPTMKEILEAEASLNIDELIEEAFLGAKAVIIG